MYLSCKIPHPAQLCVPRQGRPCQADRLVLAFCLITCFVNSINCVWVAVAGLLVPDFIYNIGTTIGALMMAMVDTPDFFASAPVGVVCPSAGADTIPSGMSPDQPLAARKPLTM